VAAVLHGLVGASIGEMTLTSPTARRVTTATRFRWPASRSARPLASELRGPNSFGALRLLRHPHGVPERGCLARYRNILAQDYKTPPDGYLNVARGAGRNVCCRRSSPVRFWTTQPRWRPSGAFSLLKKSRPRTGGALLRHYRYESDVVHVTLEDINLANGNPDAVFTAIHPDFYSAETPYLAIGVEFPDPE